MADAVERAYRLMRGNIITGIYQRGEHLRSEHVASALGVSRTPVREALRRLHSEGLVDFKTNVGARVTGWTQADLDDVFGLRVILESYAAERAATALTPEQIDEIALCAAETHVLAVERPANFRDQIAIANNRLHQIIVAAAANRRLAAMIGGVMEMPLIMRTLSYYSNEDLMRSAAHHRDLVSAFRARDSDWASSIMRSHLLAAHHVMRTAFAKSAQTEGSAGGDKAAE